MGIAPITNLIPLSTSRAVASTLEPLPMARVENSARNGDETYSPSHDQSATGSDDDSPEESAQDQFLSAESMPEESSAIQTIESPESPQSSDALGQISFFA